MIPGEMGKRGVPGFLSFDLTGLPPSPAEVDAFLADTSADACEHLVDRLLASPRCGERWGRNADRGRGAGGVTHP
jgi:hypothetical protein